jgi:AsmA protein
MRRKIAIGAGSVVVLLAGVLLALPYIVDVNRYRGQLQAAIQEQLRREVSLGTMELSLFPPGLRVQDAVIGEDPAFATGRPFVRIEELYVGPKLLPLLSGRFELRSVELRRPLVELVRTAGGTWNVSSLGRREQADTEPSPFVLDRLELTDGQVAVTAPARGAAAPGRSVYDNIDLQVDGYGPDRAFGVALGATLPGEGAQRVTLRGTAGPVPRDAAAAATPFEGVLELDGASIAGVQQFLGVGALDGTDGVISGRADARSRDGVIAATGAFRLAGARVRGVDIGYPIEADLDLSHDAGASLLTIRKGAVRLDETPLSITGTVDLRPEVPALDIHATATAASLSEAARLASAFGVAFGAGTTVEGRLDTDLRARGPATRPALEGTVRLADIRISGRDIPQPVTTGAVNLALSPDEIRSNEFTASTGGTSVNVQASVRGYTTDRPRVDARVRTASAELGEVLNVARAWGAGAEGVSGTGRVDVDVRATGPTDALSFSGSGTLADASVTAPSLAEPLRIRTATLSFSRDAAVLERLAASIAGTTAEGRLSVRSFTSPRVDFDLSADRIDVTAMQKALAPAGAGASAPRADAGGTVLSRTTGSGRLRVGSIAHDALVLEDVQSTVSIDRGIIRLDPLTAALFGGRHRGSIVADARRSPVAITVDSELTQVDANRLASAATSLRDVVFGALGTRARVGFTADGANLAPSLNGTFSMNLAEGRIANLDLMREIGNVARFVTGAPGAERSTRVAGLSGNFAVTDGLARTDDLTASIEGGTVGATGTVNLVDQSLNLRLTAVLSRAFTERVGGTRVGGFMATALANEQGELVIPLLVTGSMQQPRVAPDAQRVAEMRVKNLVPGLRDPNAMTSGILGAIAGRGREGQPARSTIGDVVGAITGRGAQPAQPDAEAPPQPPSGDTAAPAQRDRGREVQDALRGLLRGRTPPEDEKKPAEPPAEPPQ